MKKYEKYKPSAYDWLSDIPTHWQELFIQQISREQKNKNENNIVNLVLSLSYGNIIRKKNIDAGLVAKDLSTYQIVDKDNIILRFTDLQNDHKSLRTGLVKERGIISSAYTCIVPNINAAYLHYVLHSYDTQKVFYGMGGGVRQSIGYDDIRHMFVPVPTAVEQDQIVRYLDWQISRINHLIHGYQKQIKLLEERKITLIDNAVTKGINSDTPMQNISGCWMGNIPAHWRMIPSKRVFVEGKERRREGDVSATASQKYGIISQEEYMRRENRRIVVANQGLDDWKHVEPGNFVISLRSFQGGIELCEITGCVTWHYIVLLPQEMVCTQYFKWLLKSKSYIKALQGTSEFIRDGQDLRYSNFVKVDLPLIPLDEQKAIAEYITAEVAKIDNALPTFQKEIELLREYRTRLISDVVTGQIDVRDVVIPEYTPEEDTEIDTDDAGEDMEEVAEDAE